MAAKKIGKFRLIMAILPARHPATSNACARRVVPRRAKRPRFPLCEF
jgi:hypothetical protein